MELSVNKEVNASRASVKILIEVSQPSPVEVVVDAEGAEKAVKEMYDILAGSLASYLCATQIILEENPKLGIKHFQVLFKHIKTACDEAPTLGPEAVSEEPERGHLIAYQ